MKSRPSFAQKLFGSFQNRMARPQSASLKRESCRFRRLSLESLEERQLLTLIIEGAEFDNTGDYSGEGWSYTGTASAGVLTLNEYDNSRIEASDMDLQIILADGSANKVTVTAGHDAVSVTGGNLEILGGTNKTGTLEVTIDNLVPNEESNGISVASAGKNLTIQNIGALTINVTNGGDGVLVAGNLTVSDVSAFGVTVDFGDDSLYIGGDVGFVSAASDSVTLSGGLYLGGTFSVSETNAHPTPTFSICGQTVDYFVDTEKELSDALKSADRTDAVIVVTADINQSADSTTGFATTAHHNNTLLAIGNRTIKRGDNGTALKTALLSVTANSTLTLGAVGGLGSSTLAIDGGAIWAVGDSEAPVTCDIGTGENYGHQLIMRKSANSDNGGIASESALVIVSGAMNMYNGVTIQNNDNKSTVDATKYGGGVLVKPGSEFQMAGGTIYHNLAAHGGGVAVNGTNGHFTFSGGLIDYNASYGGEHYSSEGAGIIVRYGTITMTGGEVVGNVAAGYSTDKNDITKAAKGGGIHISTGATATISGGVFSENVSQWAGGGLYVGGNGTAKVDIGGSVLISNNLAIIGGGIFMNATLSITGGTIEYNRVIKQKDANTYPVCGTNGTTTCAQLPEGPGIYIKQISTDYNNKPILKLSGAVKISTTNYVFIGDNEISSRDFIPVQVTGTLTEDGLVALFNVGFQPVIGSTNIVEFKNDDGDVLPVQEDKFSIGYYLASNGTRTYGYDLKQNTKTGETHDLVVINESDNWHARVGQYYFQTVSGAMEYIRSQPQGDYELYLIYNAVLNNAMTIEEGYHVTFRSETEATQRDALNLYTRFIDYDKTVDPQNPVYITDEELLKGYGDFTLTAARTINNLTDQQAIITVNGGASLTLGTAVDSSYICFDGNYNNPLPVSGFYLGGSAEQTAVMTINAKAHIINSTNSNDAGTTFSLSDGSRTGGIKVGFGGELTMNGGEIDNCVGMFAGGVGVMEGGLFTLNDGVIHSCSGGIAGLWGRPTESNGGGGVWVATLEGLKGQFVMNGGLLEKNTGLYAGGVWNTGIFTMTGGVIDNANISTGSLETGSLGNAVFQEGEFYLSGTARIGGNTDGLSASEVQNVYLVYHEDAENSHEHVITVNAPWTGGNSSELPLIVESQRKDKGTQLVEVTFDGSADRNLDGVLNSVDAAYDLLLEHKILQLDQWNGILTGILMGTEDPALLSPAIFASNVYTTVGNGSGETGKISTYKLRSTLVRGRATVVYDPNVTYTKEEKYPEYGIDHSDDDPANPKFVDPNSRAGDDLYDGGDRVISLPFSGMGTNRYTLYNTNNSLIPVLRMLNWNTADDESGLTMFPTSTSKNSFTIVADTTLFTTWTDQAQIFVNTLRDRYEIYSNGTDSAVTYDKDTKQFNGGQIEFSDTISYYTGQDGTQYHVYWDYPTGKFFYLDGITPTELAFGDFTCVVNDGSTYKSLRVAIEDALDAVAYERATSGHYLLNPGAGAWNVTFTGDLGDKNGSYKAVTVGVDVYYEYVGYHQGNYDVVTFSPAINNDGDYNWETTFKEYVLISFDEDPSHWEDYDVSFTIEGATEHSYAWMINTDNDWVIYLSGQEYGAGLATDIGNDGTKYNHYASLPTLSDSIAIEANSLGRSLTIDGCNQSRIFSVTQGTETLPVYLSGLRMRKGNGVAQEQGYIRYDSQNPGTTGVFTGVVSDITGVDSGNGGAVAVISGAHALIEGETMRDNSVTGDFVGGTIYVAEKGTLELNGTTITHSSRTETGNAQNGGGLYNAGTVTASNVKITFCSARNDGGAIYSSGTLTLTGDSTDESYIAYNVAQNRGGGINIVNPDIADAPFATLTVERVNIAGNLAGTFGGGIASYGNIVLVSAFVRNNESKKNGGGICLSFELRNAAQNSATITASTISGNRATYGGGILNAATMTISGSNILNNSASENGGGISNTDHLEYINGERTYQKVPGFEGSVLTLQSYEGPTGTVVTKISGNTAGGYGGGVTDWGNSFTVTSGTMISGNTAAIGGGISTTTINQSPIDRTNITNNTATKRPGTENSYIASRSVAPWNETVSLGSLLSADLSSAASIAIETNGKTVTLPAEKGLNPDNLGLSEGTHSLFVRMLDAQGQNTGTAYALKVNVFYPAPVVSTKATDFANGQVLKLQAQALRSSSREIETWIIHWGDGKVSTFDNRSDLLTAAHFYDAAETDTTYSVTLELVESGASENRFAYHLLSHTVSGTGTLASPAASPLADTVGDTAGDTADATAGELSAPLLSEQALAAAEPLAALLWTAAESVDSQGDTLLAFGNTRTKSASAASGTTLSPLWASERLLSDESPFEAELSLDFVTPESVEAYHSDNDAVFLDEWTDELESGLLFLPKFVSMTE